MSRGKGWFNHPNEHALASKGFKTKGNNINLEDYRPYYIHEDEKGRVNYGIDKDGIEARMEVGEDYAVIYHLFVPKDKRGQGIGSQLVKNLVDVAEDFEINTVFVSVGFETGRLDSFMESLGFERGTLGKDLRKSGHNTQKYHKVLGGSSRE